MLRWLGVCLLAACVIAEKTDENRKTKLPFVADALGNAIPPPSSGPAPVGSPSKLLTPDRYEFYTFDDSGELVKRLMTLEEIQAIVAAGEGTDGHLVTFSNVEPAATFNFSQAPYTKVHNVVANVQNVLKAQMEAQKNNPPVHPALDTPDVSDSWSLILPTIFGNTGADIMPDKSSNAHSAPDTDTFEDDEQEQSLSKEGENNIPNSVSTKINVDVTTEKMKETKIPEKNTLLNATTSTTSKPTTAASTTQTILRTTSPTTTLKPRVTTTTTTTRRPYSTTYQPKKKYTSPIPTTSTTTTSPSTKLQSTTLPSTTQKPRITTTAKVTAPPAKVTAAPAKVTAAPAKVTAAPAKPTTVPAKPTTVPAKPTTVPARTTTTNVATKKPSTLSQTSVSPTTFKQNQPNTTERTTTKTTVTAPIKEYSNNFVPVSTLAYVTTERAYTKPTQTTKNKYSFSTTTKRTISTSSTESSDSIKLSDKTPINKPTQKINFSISTPSEFDRNENATTLTTQSVSPSTAISSTEFMLVDKPSTETSTMENESSLPLFDISESFSQIATDLGNPRPSSSNIVDKDKSGGIDVESKESLEIDIPNDVNTTSTSDLQESKPSSESYIKISTLDPPVTEGNFQNNVKNKSEVQINLTSTTTEISTSTGIDPILSESMVDLLSQIVNQDPQRIVQKPLEEMSTILPHSQLSTTTSSVYSSTTTPAATTTKLSTAQPSPTTFSDKVTIKESVSEENTNISQINNIMVPTNHSVSLHLNSDKNKHVVVMGPIANAIIKTNEKAAEKNISKTYVQLEKATTAKPIIQISTLSNDIKQSSLESYSSTTQKQYVTQKTPTTGMPNNNFKEVTTTQKTYIILNRFKENNTNEIIKTLPKETQNYNDSKIQDPIMSPGKFDEFKKKIQKVNIDDKEFVNERNSSWKLISTVKPPSANEIQKDKLKTETNYFSESDESHKDINLDVSKENQGLEVTTKDLSEDMAQFTELCNELAFRYWSSVTENIEKKRSFVLSPYSITSMLAMMFMGARGATSGEMNDILKLDDMVTFNPHFTLKNISDSIETTPESGVSASTFVRELYSDRTKGKLLTFYKERATHFYNGHVEEVNFKLISDIIRRRTNLLVKRYTWGKITEYLKSNSIMLNPPLAAFSANIFETDCSGTSVEGRDGEMYFVVSPTVRQRRLVPVPAVVYRKGFLAGYDPMLDATAAAVGSATSIVSTLFLMPGQQGNVVHAEDLEALERRLLDSNPTTPTWNRLLRTLLPRIGLELQIPRFSHKSVFNISSTLKNMGLKELFNNQHADLGGLNGPSKDLYLSDMVQMTTFVTCGEGVVGEQHHVEEYPDSLELARRRRTSRWTNGWDEPRDYQRAFHDPHDIVDALQLPLHLRPRQARLPARDAQPARLKFDRPFLYFVRHNPSGMILYVGRYNPRLLP